VTTVEAEHDVGPELHHGGHGLMTGVAVDGDIGSLARAHGHSIARAGHRNRVRPPE
jgi:hypothetical protein